MFPLDTVVDCDPVCGIEGLSDVVVVSTVPDIVSVDDRLD